MSPGAGNPPPRKNPPGGGSSAGSALTYSVNDTLATTDLSGSILNALNPGPNTYPSNTLIVGTSIGTSKP